MRLYIKDDTTKVVCSKCEDIVTATFGYHNVPFSDGLGVVKGILAATCNKCEQIVAIPQQSIPKIRESRAKALNSVEAIVPAVLIDALNIASQTIDSNFSQEFRKKAIWFFVREYAKKNENEVCKIRNEYVNSANKFGTVSSRLSFKVSEAMLNDLKKASIIFGGNQTETIKIASFDFFKNVVECKNNRIISKLKDIAYMS